jgi:signal transduction histidine kinase/ligand-binding sensor domain-containing protein
VTRAALVLCALLLVGVKVLAEDVSGRFLIRSWQSEDGLPGNVIRSVTQAADGYLWVATAEGVVRFDGVRFSGFAPEPDAKLALLPPRALFALASGEVWVATWRGGLLRWKGGRLSSVWEDAPASVPSTHISQVLQVRQVGAEVIIARGDQIWKVRGNELPERAENTPEIDALFHPEEAILQTGRRGETPFLRDRQQQLWRVTSTGLTVTTPEGRSEPVVLPNVEPAHRISDLFEDREGSIWVATGESGLVQIRARRVEVFGVADGLSDRTVFSVLESRDKALWIGTKLGGLERLAKGTITHFNVGTGIVRPISALAEDSQGTLWAAARHGSVFRFDGEAFVPAFPAAPALGKVEAILEAGGELWLGGLQGLSRAKGGVVRPGDEGPWKDGVEVTALASGTADTVWAGTSQGAVLRGQDGHFVPIGATDSLNQRRITGLHADQDGSLWGTTLGAGLFYWRTGRLTVFGQLEGLSDPRLTCIMEEAGYFWLGSLGGIFRVSKTELAAVETGSSKSAHFLRLDRSDGLLSRECTGLAQPAGWRNKEGHMWFPTVNGLVRVRPDRLALNLVPPPVYIEECRGNGKVLDLAQPLRLGPGRARLSFRFTGLSLAAPEKVGFRVRLSGLEQEWRSLTERTVGYEAVPPGRYQFEVLAVNGDGVWSSAPALLAIEVLPRVYETAWFRALAVAVAGALALGIGWSIARVRLDRRLSRLRLQHAREAERSRIARDLHDDLGASLTEISMLANLAVEDFGSNASVRDPLREIAGKSQSLVGALDEIVWAVNPRHDTLASLADYLAAYAADFLSTAGIKLRLEVPQDLPSIPFDAEHRHALFLAVRETLNNVVKHSEASEVWLRVRIEDRTLRVLIEDNGAGFDPTKIKSGEGLRNLRDRLIPLGGEARIESIQGTGTSVCLVLPLP